MRELMLCSDSSVEEPKFLMLSDDGTIFICANRELREALVAVNHNQIQRALILAGVYWKFNPPGASHFGNLRAQDLNNKACSEICVVPAAIE